LSFYITKRNQTYYYRIKIPSDLTHLIPSREIKQSLRTRNLDAAKVTAAGINVKVQSLFALLRVGDLGQDKIPELVAGSTSKKGDGGIFVFCLAWRSLGTPFSLSFRFGHSGRANI